MRYTCKSWILIDFLNQLLITLVNNEMKNLIYRMSELEKPLHPTGI